MNWSVIFEPGTLALYGEGLLMTLQLTFYSLGIGAVLALGCALALVSPRLWLRWPAQAFTYFMRGTPLLIQVYLIYYGVAQLEWCKPVGMRCGPGRSSKSLFSASCCLSA